MTGSGNQLNPVNGMMLNY